MLMSLISVDDSDYSNSGPISVVPNCYSRSDFLILSRHLNRP